MMAGTMYETLASLLGLPMCAIPLSYCHIRKSYLLERAGIGTSGTAMILAIPYLVTADVNDPARNLSLYAVPRDYHDYVTELGKNLLPKMKESFPHYTFALFADHSPIAEVDAAARAGLGVRGENGLLITPHYGSFVFLAEVCTDADYGTVTGRPVPEFPSTPPMCERCGACRTACPMRDGKTPCLSDVTQKKGELTADDADALRAHDLVWGCDACQLVCPHNRAVIQSKRDTAIPYFRADRIIAITSASVSAMDDAAFTSRAFSWRGRQVILRNLQLKEETP